MTIFTSMASAGTRTGWRTSMATMGTCLALLMPVAAVAEQDPISGGTMTIINGSDITSWDPALTNGTYPGGPMDVRDAVYGFVVYVNVMGEVTGGMAESLTSEDAVTWTLKLREGVTFTDGNPYDAEAVKYNWDRAADPATAAPSQAFVASWNKGITVVDPMTLTIKLPAANSNFAAQVAELSPFIASPAALEGVAQKTDIKPVGAGAFVLDNWDQGISMTLKRNPEYWDQPRPYLDTLKFAIIPETNSRIATVVQGGATMMAGYPYQFGNNADAPGVATKEIPIRGINRGYFNSVNGIMTDPRAREAFYAAVDRTRLMKAFTQIDGFTEPVSYFGEDSTFFDPAHTLPEYNPERAQELMDELAADGKPFDITLVTYTNSDQKRLVGFIQQMINSYNGASAKIVEVDLANLVDRCKVQLAYDVCLEGGVLVSNGAEPNISNLLSASGALNWGQYNSADMEAALKAAGSTVKPEEIKAAYSDVQKLIVEDLPLYIFGEQTRSLLLRDDTGGVVNSNGGILQKQYLFVCPGPCVE